jgi:hypothetical protein
MLYLKQLFTALDVVILLQSVSPFILFILPDVSHLNCQYAALMTAEGKGYLQQNFIAYCTRPGCSSEPIKCANNSIFLYPSCGQGIKTKNNDRRTTFLEFSYQLKVPTYVHFT